MSDWTCEDDLVLPLIDDLTRSSVGAPDRLPVARPAARRPAGEAPHSLRSLGPALSRSGPPLRGEAPRQGWRPGSGQGQALARPTASLRSLGPAALRHLHYLRCRLFHAVDPPILLPLVIALGMLAYVSYLASAPRSSTQLWHIMQQTWLLVVILTVPYLAARLFVWYTLLCQLGIAVPWRQLTVAFAAGEATKSLPAGVYLQNYLLGRLNHLGRLSVVRSTMATTAMLGLESLVAVPVAFLIGLPGASWARVTLLAVVLAWIAVLLLAWLLVRYRARHMSPRVAPWRRRLVAATEEFLAAGGELITPRTARTLVPTAIYQLIYVIDLYAIIRAAGVHSISFVDTLGVLAFLVLAVILVPIPTEIGITEFTGLGVLLAYGLPGPTAAVVMLSLRVLATGATIALAGALLLLLRRELASTGRAAQEGPATGPCTDG